MYKVYPIWNFIHEDICYQCGIDKFFAILFSKRGAFFNRENYQFESESTPGEDWWIQSAANNAVR